MIWLEVDKSTTFSITDNSSRKNQQWIWAWINKNIKAYMQSEKYTVFWWQVYIYSKAQSYRFKVTNKYCFIHSVIESEYWRKIKMFYTFVCFERFTKHFVVFNTIIDFIISSWGIYNKRIRKHMSYKCIHWCLWQHYL